MSKLATMIHSIKYSTKYNLEIVKLLVERGANVNTYNKNTTALETALYHSNEGIINHLIEHGADVNFATSGEYTPLHLAIHEGFKKTIDLLIENGANVNAVAGEMKVTPLHVLVASDKGNRKSAKWTPDDVLSNFNSIFEYVKLLVNHGADVYAKATQNGEEVTPLDMATSTELRRFLGSKMGVWEWLKTRW